MMSSSSQTMTQRGRSYPVCFTNQDKKFLLGKKVVKEEDPVDNSMKKVKLILCGKVVENTRLSSLKPYLQVGRLIMHVEVHSITSENYEDMELVRKKNDLFVFFNSKLFKIDPKENFMQL